MASADKFTGQLGSLYENIEKLATNNRPMNEGEWLVIADQFKKLYEFKKILTPDADAHEDDEDEDEDEEYECYEWRNNGKIYLCLQKEGDHLLDNLLLSEDGKRIIGRLHEKTTIEHLEPAVLANIMELLELSI
jgi:hypothetical protein